jgi:hypothetical protein
LSSGALGVRSPAWVMLRRLRESVDRRVQECHDGI